MPSSLTIVLPIALVFSTRPPVSVWGTGTVLTHCWAFLDSMGSVTSSETTRHHVSALRPQLSSGPAYTLTRGLPSPRFTYPPASPSSYPPAARWDRPKSAPTSQLLGLARTRWYWNINQLCIDYAFRPRLSSRLTLGGLAFPRNPWAFGGGVSHPSLATHASILTRARSTPVHTAASLQDRRSPTTPALLRAEVRGFGSGLEPRYIVRAGPLDQ